MAKNDQTPSFEKGEVEALRRIVQDWLGEELVVPPFPPEVVSILKKLNLPVADAD